MWMNFLETPSVAAEPVHMEKIMEVTSVVAETAILRKSVVIQIWAPEIWGLGIAVVTPGCNYAYT